MSRAQSAAETLADRLRRPQRVGIFGYRGVGKTTLVTMLYREAVGGRLPEMRLAAADARTAEYLADKIVQLEAGQVLPATLAETDLRFHFYHRGGRFELLVKDYQGEHVELGRDEPIRAFLRTCDAVWLCVDAAVLASPGDRLRRQQEVEQLIEDYLAAEPGPTMDRPVAFVLTKADLLGSQADGTWAEPLDLVRHALHMHCPNSGVFPVSSLGGSLSSQSEPSPNESDSALPALQPRNLTSPLAWMSAALQVQDEARVNSLWSLAGSEVRLLSRAVDCFAARYPQAPATAAFRERLRELRRRRLRRFSLIGAVTAACLVLGVWTYDAIGRQGTIRFETEHPDDPGAALVRWQSYRAWHPTRNWLQSATARAEEAHLSSLAQAAREQERTARLAELRRQVEDPDASPEAVWHLYEDFHAQYPEVSVAGDLERLRAVVKQRRDDQVNQKAQAAYDELVRAETRSADLLGLVSQTDTFLANFPATPPESEVRARRARYLARLDERDVAEARDYSAAHPLHFQTRLEHYRRYLERHPGGGAFTKEAEEALRTIDADWDKHDFRSVRDHYTAQPGDIPELVARCRSYLAAHPHGRFASSATELLRWSECVTAPGEYRVILRQGQFDKSVARFFSRGPKLSVEIEVNGVRHGPSSIVYNRYDPEWNYEFPRRIRWKLGEPVHIWVTEHSWKDRVVMDVESGDPLAIRLLTGEVNSGPNRIAFESDFAMPALPKIE
jgi:hypothetical protein